MKHYSQDTINKVGNAIIYMSERIPDLSKTKLLKLLYLLEECSSINNKTPFFGLNFEVWQAGPVEKDIFIDLSDNEPSLLRDFINLDSIDGRTYISSKIDFCDDEFTDLDIELMDYVITKFGKKTASLLVKYTHKEESAWYKAASDNQLLDLFNSKIINSSTVPVDLTHYLSGCEKQFYEETKETMDTFNMLKL